MTDVVTRPLPALLVFAEDWGRHASGCQHLVRHFLGRYEVYWVNTIGTRRPRFDPSTLTRGLEKLRQWTPLPRKTPSLPARLHVLNPWMWPWFCSASDRRINRELLYRQLGPLIRSLPVPPIAITKIPIVADLLGLLPVRRWVYYCVDDLGQWPGLDQAALRQMEELLVQRADVLIAVSETLQDRLARMGRSSHLLTHGVDVAHWRSNGDAARLPALHQLQRPLVVFWGLIDRRMDPDLVSRLAADLTQGTIVLAGPEADPDPALYASARVVHLPALPYQQLPHLAAAAEVLIMPYADLPVTHAIQPLKMKEYLATGKAVVVRDLPATRPWSPALDLADSPETFSRAVRLRLAEGVPAEQQQVRTCLTGEHWAYKAEQFARWALE